MRVTTIAAEATTKATAEMLLALLYEKSAEKTKGDAVIEARDVDSKKPRPRECVSLRQKLPPLHKARPCFGKAFAGRTDRPRRAGSPIHINSWSLSTNQVVTYYR